MIFRLDEDDISFPPAELAEEDGLLAVGGDLSLPRLLNAYSKGIFPWYSDDTPILWYSPHERFVLFPEKVKVSKSMRKLLESGRFSVTADQAFDRVISSCAFSKRKDDPGTWITSDMMMAYQRLFDAGYAHSVEVWCGDELAGGLYGVRLGDVFCGESMFSTMSNASKIALIWLCRNGGYKMIDCQLYTSHLESLGAELISREEYLEYLGSV